MKALLALQIAFLTANPFDEASKPIIELVKNIRGPAIALVGAIGAVYCIILGVKFAKAEEPQDRDKAKGALKNAIIGFILIFVLLVALSIMVPAMSTWMNANTK